MFFAVFQGNIHKLHRKKSYLSVLKQKLSCGIHDDTIKHTTFISSEQVCLTQSMLFNLIINKLKTCIQSEIQINDNVFLSSIN